MTEDPLEVVEPKDPEDGLQDEIVKHILTFHQNSQEVVSGELSGWQRAEDMWLSCFDDADDDKDIYNPTLLSDIVYRAIDQYQLAPYQLIIPGATDVQEQIVRDAIAQQKIVSGLVSSLRDDPKGALSQLLLGNCLLTWGAGSKEDRKKGIAIKFRANRISQAFFTPSATKIRMPNGDYDATEGLIIAEFPKGEVDAMYPKAKEASSGRLPLISDDELQDENESLKLKDKVTQVGHYYNVEKGIYYIIVGASATVVEAYSDEDKRLPKYQWKLDGMNYIPASLLVCFPQLGQLYAKGLYHRFAKIARNDARRRIMAHKYVERNIYPDKFIVMDDENFATFEQQLWEVNRIRAQGEDAYVRINPGEEIKTGDLRGVPLSNEFERMKADDLDQVSQGGIAIRDVDRPVSESATATAAEEIAKTRLGAYITKINASESVFLTRIILDFIKRYIASDNETPVATEAKAPALMDTGNGMMEVPGEEVRMNKITLGAVADFLRKNPVFIKEDLSQYEGIGLELARLQAAMQLAMGTPHGARLQQKALGLLGQDTTIQNLAQPQNAGQGTPNPTASLGQPGRAGLPAGQQLSVAQGANL